MAAPFEALRGNRHPTTGQRLTAREMKDRVAFSDVQLSTLEVAAFAFHHASMSPLLSPFYRIGYAEARQAAFQRRTNPSFTAIETAAAWQFTCSLR